MVYEGIAGFIFWAIALPIFQHIPCDIKSVCVNGVIEDTVGVFEDYAANSTLIVISTCLIFVSLTVNSTGVGITKYGSAAQRATIGLAKNMLVWIVFLVTPIAYYDFKKQEWDSKQVEKFDWLQLVGFLVLVSGVLIFNEIIEIPWLGFSKYTKA